MHDQLNDLDDLYRTLSNAVEEIQGQIAQGSDVIWNCSAVDKLCFCMEDIFNHGLKEGLLSWASNNQVSFWSLANKITCKKDIEDINRLRIKGDQERCLAWIRQGLKENTLGSYLNVITQDEKLLREFYYSHAFLCDRENAVKVKDLITYGISHLDFDISLSSSSRRPMEVEAKPVIIAADAIITHLPDRSSHVNGYGSPSSSWNGCENSAQWYTQETRSLKIEETGKKKKKRKKTSVAMIAESADVEESQYIEKVIQMHRDWTWTFLTKKLKQVKAQMKMIKILKKVKSLIIYHCQVLWTQRKKRVQNSL
ncbi:zinc ion binding [Desmophyllum pertusum]|uniref:Zinc ion binding n=1 Tax=Desmophyllum pertusum TaxID=174260 RepID=A0A9X0CVA4_9CNID|nr:zinc ion binding [Desmophyllum pertusum]